MRAAVSRGAAIGHPRSQWGSDGSPEALVGRRP